MKLRIQRISFDDEDRLTSDVVVESNADFHIEMEKVFQELNVRKISFIHIGEVVENKQEANHV